MVSNKMIQSNYNMHVYYYPSGALPGSEWAFVPAQTCLLLEAMLGAQIRQRDESCKDSFLLFSSFYLHGTQPKNAMAICCLACTEVPLPSPTAGLQGSPIYRADFCNYYLSS